MDQNQNPSTALSVPLGRNAVNFAPVKPLQKLLQDKKPPKPTTAFEKSFKKWYDAKMAENNSAWVEIYSMAQLTALFRQGNQLLVRRPYGATGYYVRPIGNDDTYRQTAMNFMGFHAQVIESKIVASNPNVNIRGADDSPEAIATAQACRPIVDHYETEWYTSKFTRREAIALETDGMFIHRVRWNPFKGGRSVQTRQVSQVQRQDEGYGECAECPATGTAEMFAQGCPECGSRLVDVRPPQTTNLSQISMGDSVPVGEPEIINTPLMGWRWDMAKDLEESSWAIYRQRITQGAINLMVGDVVIPDSKSSDDYGLEMLRVLNTAGQAYAGSSNQSFYGGGRDMDVRPTLAECWLSPEDQAEIEFDECETISGQTIPKGRMSDFTKGKPACVISLNDASTVIGVYVDDSHCREVVTGQWLMQAQSGVGRGMEDSAAVQRRFNAVDGQVYQGLANTATPAAITDLSIFKEDQANYLFRPGVNIDVNLALLPPNTSLKDAFYLPPAGNINQQYIQYGSTFLMQMAEISSLSVEYSDMLSIDNRTATGAQITAALANSLYAPMLATKGQARVRIAQMIVELHRQHSVAGRYFSGKGSARGRQVSAEDLKGKVIFELVQNSELPVTPFSQQTEVTSFFQAYGGAPVAAQMQRDFPEFFRATSAPFNINWGQESADEISTLCLQRLEQMRENLKAGVADPNELIASIRPPISKIEPKHVEKAQWYASYLDLQQGQEAPIELRTAIEGVYWLHMNLNAQKEMPTAAMSGLTAGIGEAASMAPAALGGAMLQQSQPEPQVEDKSLQIEADVAMQKSEEENDLRLKQLEGETQLQVAELQKQTQIETTKLQGQNQLKAAKVSASKAKAREKAA